MTIKKRGVMAAGALQCDPAVKLPTAIQSSIRPGEVRGTSGAARARNLPSQPGLEMAAGRKAVERHKLQSAAARRATVNKDLGVLIAEKLPCDPDVTLPADVQATIARGEAAFNSQKPYKPPRNYSGRMPKVITSVADQKLQDRRDANVAARAQPSKGARQPPMLHRLQAVAVVVDRLRADGVPLGVGPNSKMNKAVRQWLHERARRSSDDRKSRQKEITPTAVRALLRQVRDEGRSVPKAKSHRRLTTQEAARERLRELRERRASGTE